MSEPTPEPRYSSVASRNALTAVAARLTTIVVGLILTPFVLGRLEARMYGLVIAVSSVYEYLSLLRGGMGGALRRYVTLHHHAGRKDLAREYYDVGFWWAGILRTVVLILGLALAWPITGFFRIEAAARPEATLGIILVFLAAVLSDLGALFNVPIYATGRTQTISLVQIGEGALRIVVLYVALSWIGSTLGIYGGALVVLELCSVATFLVLAQRSKTVGPAVPRPRLGQPAVRRELFRYGGLALLSQAAGLLYLSTDHLLIGRIYGPESITHYSLGTRWAPLLRGFLVATMAGLSPIFTSLEARGLTERSRSALLRVLEVTAALAVPLCLAPCIVGDLFLEHWVGAEYRDSARYMVAMLAPAAIDGALTPLLMALTAKGRIGWIATSDIVVAVGNVVISLVLAVPLGLGLMGFALGNTIALLVRNALLVFVVRRRDETMPELLDILRPLLRAGVGALPGLAALWVLRPLYGGSLSGVVVAGLAGGALGTLGAILATIGPRGMRRLWDLRPGRGVRETAG